MRPAKASRELELAYRPGCRLLEREVGGVFWRPQAYLLAFRIEVEVRRRQGSDQETLGNAQEPQEAA